MNNSELIKTLADKLGARQWLFATAESCTGGMLAAACTDLAGSSNWFECGLVTYSNQAKQSLLQVSEQTLAKHGAVSEATVREMVAGVLQATRAHCAVAISGIAGPGGGSDDKPVGMVCFAWGARGYEVHVQTHYFAGDRHEVRAQATTHAIAHLIGLLDYEFRIEQ